MKMLTNGMVLVTMAALACDQNTKHNSEPPMGEIIRAVSGDHLEAQKAILAVKRDYERVGSIMELAAAARALQHSNDWTQAQEPVILPVAACGDLNDSIKRAWQVKKVALWNKHRANGPCLEIVITNYPVSVLIYRDFRIVAPAQLPREELSASYEYQWDRGVYIVYMGRVMRP